MLLNYLKPMAIFATVVESQSFTKAGEKLDMPRGKVSEQVSRLETYLGVKLFNRSTRKVSITAEGVALYQHAQFLLRNGVSGVDEVKSLSEKVKGNIRITVTDDFNEALLLPLLQPFCEKYPEVTFDIVTDDSTLSVIDDSIDLAIRSGELADSSLVSMPLSKTKLKLYGGEKFVDYVSDSLDSVEGLSWISLNNEKPNLDLVTSNKSGDSHSFSPQYKHSANSISSYVAMIENNLGVGLMTELSAQEWVKKGKLVDLLPSWDFGELPISILYPSRRHMAYRTRLLLDELKKINKI
ncbi:LysR family transcriptional regulator [Vibrio penaeicida]|uniref:LysR family transcriptional regulator n=1 Tax=Vibrio penaeicida TaxID=104609 RepID=UPI000CE9DD8E|nr:LysR family transcriptional regulator [Vibrio penaeicida]